MRPAAVFAILSLILGVSASVAACPCQGTTPCVEKTLASPEQIAELRPVVGDPLRDLAFGALMIVATLLLVVTRPRAGMPRLERQAPLRFNAPHYGVRAGRSCLAFNRRT